MAQSENRNIAPETECFRDSGKQTDRQQAAEIPVVTQNVPDDMYDNDGPMAVSGAGESPTRRELEQDVIATNPSVESMESRG